MNDIRNYNEKQELHGYQEWYIINILYNRGNFKNDDEIGYEEWHYFKETNFYIK